MHNGSSPRMCLGYRLHRNGHLCDSICLLYPEFVYSADLLLALYHIINSDFVMNLFKKLTYLEIRPYFMDKFVDSRSHICITFVSKPYYAIIVDYN